MARLSVTLVAMLLAFVPLHAQPQAAASSPSQLSGAPPETTIALIEALALKRTGHLDQAIAIFRRLLDADPARDDIRFQLADALFTLGDDIGAQHHFERLLETERDNARIRLYQSYISAIRARRPWSFEGAFGLVPSTNVNNGASNAIVFIGGIPFVPNNQAKSGIGVEYSGAASYRHPLTEHLSVIFGASANGTTHENSDFDSFRLRSFSELSLRSGPLGLGAGVNIERTFAGWQGHSWAMGPQLSAQYSFPEAGTLRAQLSWLYREHDVVTAFDGPETELSLSYTQTFDHRLTVQTGARFRRVGAQTDFNSFVSASPHISVDFDLDHNFRLHGSLSYEVRQYLGAFPLLGTERRDDRFDIGAGVTMKGLAVGNFMPRIDYRYRKTHSNVGLYTSDSHSLGLSVSRRY